MKNLEIVLVILACVGLIVLLLGFKLLRKRTEETPAAPAPVSVRQAPSFESTTWEKIDQDILEGNYGLMNSVLVIEDNKITLEKYYNGWNRDQLHDIQSATKSVTSALIGIALDKGLISSVHDRIVTFFPDYQRSSSEALNSEITLENLLTMTAGLEWDEHSKKYFEPENSLTDMYNNTSDWVSYILDLPVCDKPGTKFNYNSGISILLGSILQNSSKKKVQAFAEEHLFQPLGIENYYWSEFSGLAHCGGGLYLTSRDMAKIGQLYLNDGRWHGRQIISQHWIEQSLAPRYKVDNNTYYGYHFWSLDSMLGLQPIPFAGGNGWQYIFIIKEFNMVIVFTAKNYAQETPKTTFSQMDLLFGILAGHPKFKKHIMDVYDHKVHHPTEDFHETFVLAQSLNRTGAYKKTIRFLEPLREKFGNNIVFNYLLGEAYYETRNAAKAKTYLLQCMSINDAKEYPKEGYYRSAEKMLKKSP